MKICIAQTASLKGAISENIDQHLFLIKKAVAFNIDLILFPELSITGYEPDLAAKLATYSNDDIFKPFETLSTQHQLTIGVGMPTKSVDGINISTLIFQAKQERIVYSKQLLHPDELPYFVCGNDQIYLNIKNHKIAIGICYESLQRSHFLNAKRNNIDLYIASVAKSQEGIEKAYSHFSAISKEFNIPILLSNSIGYCDNFLSAGQSAIWNKKGALIGQLDQQNQGFLVFDTTTEQLDKKYLI